MEPHIPTGYGACSGLEFGQLLHRAQRSKTWPTRPLPAGGGGGLLLILWLGFFSVGAGLVGLLVFGSSALAAFAANAKQVSRVEPTTFSEPGQFPMGVRHAGLRGAEGEGGRYTGPVPWARRLGRLQAAGRRAPHWFVRPLTYARIRAAYERMGGKSPLPATLDALTNALAIHLGSDYVVHLACLSTEPLLADVLRSLPKEGIGQVTVIAFHLDAAATNYLRAQLTASRLRERGIPLRVASYHSASWANFADEQRLRQFSQGQPAAAPDSPTPEMVQALGALVRAEGNVSAS